MREGGGRYRSIVYKEATEACCPKALTPEMSLQGLYWGASRTLRGSRDDTHAGRPTIDYNNKHTGPGHPSHLLSYVPSAQESCP